MFGPIVRFLNRVKFNRIINDLKSPSGKYAAMLEQITADTANYVADKLSPTFFTSRTGTLIEGVRRSYIVKHPQYIELTDEEKMDAYVNSHNKSKRSIYNKRVYPSYWHFIVEGWGGRKAGTGERYKLAYIVKNKEGNVYITSPFNPDLPNLTTIHIIRHPGREARDWYKILQTDYNKYFNDKLKEKTVDYLNGFKFL